MTPSKDLDLLTPQKISELTCWSAYGKGRLTGPQRKVVFEYEALYESELWKMALMIPVHGQEMLSFEWSVDKKAQKTSGQFEGRAVQRLQKVSADDGGREALLLKKAWPALEASVSLFFASLENFDHFCKSSSAQKASCQSKSGEELNWLFSSDQVIAKAELNEQMQMEIRLHDKQKAGLKRFELFIYERPRSPQSRPTLGLELFANECHLP